MMHMFMMMHILMILHCHEQSRAVPGNARSTMAHALRGRRAGPTAGYRTALDTNITGMLELLHHPTDADVTPGYHGRRCTAPPRHTKLMSAKIVHV